MGQKRIQLEEMAELEKRGPIEKGKKGWPINPFGVVALVIFALIVVFLIIRPLLSRPTTVIQQNQQENANIAVWVLRDGTWQDTFQRAIRGQKQIAELAMKRFF